MFIPLKMVLIGIDPYPFWKIKKKLRILGGSRYVQNGRYIGCQEFTAGLDQQIF